MNKGKDKNNMKGRCYPPKISNIDIISSFNCVLSVVYFASSEHAQSVLGE